VLFKLPPANNPEFAVGVAMNTAPPEVNTAPAEVWDDDGDGSFEARKRIAVINPRMPYLVGGMRVRLAD
jgi:hypothetical protein